MAKIYGMINYMTNEGGDIFSDSKLIISNIKCRYNKSLNYYTAVYHKDIDTTITKLDNRIKKIKLKEIKIEKYIAVILLKNCITEELLTKLSKSDYDEIILFSQVDKSSCYDNVLDRNFIIEYTLNNNSSIDLLSNIKILYNGKDQNIKTEDDKLNELIKYSEEYNSRIE